MLCQALGARWFVLSGLSLLVVTGCTNGSSRTSPPVERVVPIDELILRLNESELQKADSAYRNLFERGSDAIPALLANAEQAELFSGHLHVNETESVAPGGVTRGVVSLYLIEAIRTNKIRPHRAAALVSAGAAPADRQALAKDHYERWWAAVTDRTRAGVRAAPDPLEGSGLTWFGYQ